MRTDQVRLRVGFEIHDRLRKRFGRGTLQKMGKVFEERPDVLDRCAELFAVAIDVFDGVITPTTFGPAIQPPFKDAILDQDGPGDDEFRIEKLTFVPILTETDPEYITMERAVQRGQANPAHNWGQRLAFRLRNAGNNGEISKDVWPVGIYVICSKTVWRRSDGNRCAWYVVRHGVGFSCYYDWFSDDVRRSSHLPSLSE